MNSEDKMEAVVAYLDENEYMRVQISDELIDEVYDILIDGNTSHTVADLCFYYCLKYVVDGDYDKVIEYLAKSVESDEYDALDFLMDIGKFGSMINGCVELAQDGNVACMKIMGEYYKRKGDIDRMLEYYHMAVKYGDIETMYILGNHYLGTEDEEDLDNAIKYLTMAANAGHVFGMLLLADIFDAIACINNAEKYYHMASNNGSYQGTFWLIQRNAENQEELYERFDKQISEGNPTLNELKKYAKYFDTNNAHIANKCLDLAIAKSEFVQRYRD